MNRGFLIILIPALLVATGYILIFWFMGVAPGYGRLAGAMVVFFGGFWWLGGTIRRRPLRRRATEIRK